MANYKIYLSSTFRDLEAYRKAVLDLLGYFREQLPVNAMEIYIAEDVCTLEKCIADVQQCDIYILLLGNRYGSIAPNNTAISNPDRKSYTHLEYDAAEKAKKTIWVYTADLARVKSGTFPEDADGPDKAYQRNMLGIFMAEATKRLSMPFAEPADLTRLVAASIIKKIMSDPGIDTKLIDANWKHCCDRSEQFTKYEQNRLNPASLFHLFLGSGNEADIPSNLTIRCAIFSLHLAEENILSIYASEFYDDDSDEVNLHNFIYRLHRKLEPNSDIQTSSEEELKKAIARYAAPDIVIKMISEEETIDEKILHCMARVFQMMKNLCLPGGEIQKRIYFFYYIQDDMNKPERIRETDKKLDWLKAHTQDISAIFFKRFSTLNKEHIRTWIDNYFTSDEWKIVELYKENFQDLPASFRMLEAESRIRQLFQRLKKKDEKILNILNS